MRLLHLKWSSLSRRAVILFGLLAGFFVSLFTPYFNNCLTVETTTGFQLSRLLIKSSNWFEEIINSDFNPIVKLPLTNVSSKPSEQLKSYNSKRPRFVLDELDVNDQLLIVVLTSDQTYFNLGQLLNETLSSYADRILFFKESIYSDSSVSPSSSQSPSASVSTPSSSSSSPAPLQLPLSSPESSFPLVYPSPSLINLYPSQTPEPVLSRILNYLDKSYDSGKVKSYLRGHNFIFFISDNSYVKGDALRSIVDNLSISDHIFALGGDIGVDLIDSNQFSSCSSVFTEKSNLFHHFLSGLLVSTSLIVSCRGQLECLKLACNDTLIKSYRLSPDHSDKLLLDSDLFRSSLITYPLFTTKVYVNVHHFYLQSSLNNYLKQLSQLERKISTYVDNHKHKTHQQWTSTWPLGIISSHRPVDRFDVVRWTYIENGLVYMPDDFEVLRKENEAEKIDRETIEYLTGRWLITQYPDIKSVDSIQFTGVYRRFDANRGMDYVMNLNILTNQGSLTNFPIRIEAVKPLVPMTIIDQIPFATEQSRITLVVPVRSDGEVSDIISLMNQYVNLCNEKQWQSRNLALIIALITQNSSPPSGYGRVISLQSKLSSLECKLLLSTIPREPNESYSTSTDLGLLMLLKERFTQILMDSIIVLSTSNTLINSNYLARIQLNTIKGHQIFFPIPFQAYNLRPSSSGSSSEYSWKITKDSGFFNWFDYRHAAFYMEDLEKALKTVLANLKTKTNKLLDDYDLLEIFLQFNCQSPERTVLHILRSIEPKLKLSYRDENCDQKADKFTQQWCNMTLVYSFGNKAQMANLIFNYKKIKFTN